jgi:hypothetical protein
LRYLACHAAGPLSAGRSEYRGWAETELGTSWSPLQDGESSSVMESHDAHAQVSWQLDVRGLCGQARNMPYPVLVH